MKQKTVEAMRPIVEAYARFTGSKKSFCSERGIAVHTLDYWRRKFSSDTLGKAAGSFISLELEEPLRGRMMEIHYPNGIEVRLPVDVTGETLYKLLNFGN